MVYSPTAAAGPDLTPVWALLTADRNEVSFYVLIGLAVIAFVWILAGLYMIRSAEDHTRVRR